MLSFLIVGATGKQGGRTITTLLEGQGSTNREASSIHFLTRNPDGSAAKSLTAKGAKAFKGDLFDQAGLKEALKGVNRAFLVTDAAVGEEKEIQQGKNFVDVAKAQGVEHIVFSSVGGADVADTVPHFRSKFEVEKHLKASGMTYTILRPVAFMDNFPPAPGIARFLGVGVFYSFAGHKPVQLIATEDIGVFAGKALLDPHDPKFLNKTIELSAGTYSLADVEAGFAKVQGAAPWVARYTPKVLRNLIPFDFRQMMIFFEEKGYPPPDVAYLKSIHPGLMSFEDWVRKQSK
ncbi:hypothetical protein CI109_106026 [Kwoniella shandongensis]|uniref:NmrA-like domain-containing protein n=1 Tax=Kwoniella shandongensis TaxID=1734106 RepID=A0A5M6C241_9TREE|nr:uncharacterized protein CI109_003924 [Kwoniella shandongensis]KAA5527665.1 hypothetical protein CI109_003924 [Kwoniella shandongensis]